MPPSQAPKTEPCPGVAVSSISIPFASCALHEDPQAIPSGREPTRPFAPPGPLMSTDKVCIVDPPLPAALPTPDPASAAARPEPLPTGSDAQRAVHKLAATMATPSTNRERMWNPRVPEDVFHSADPRHLSGAGSPDWRTASPALAPGGAQARACRIAVLSPSPPRSS